MIVRCKSFFDEMTATFTYVVDDGPGTPCAIIDSVLNYDPKSGRTSTESADQIIAYIRHENLRVQWLLETHAHADHLSAAPYIRRAVGGKIAIGSAIQTVQGVFKKIFNLEPEFQLDGSQFDYLFEPDEVFHIGNIQAQAWHVPGHTPADMAYLVNKDTMFVGDTLFMPDVGSARCDFPGGSAPALYASARRILALPDQTRLMMCHDYPPGGREVRHETTVAQQRAHNIHLRDGISEQEFVNMRTTRDDTLAMPTLLLPSIQVNIRAGEFPPAESNGIHYLKIPINAL
ncbi:MBL fold metallo-hydrolase [Orrella marina]|uniref:MBL fold metallo-hydrolase n=2 Tax=Orrella marina TaxID=2163011 RepID=A0A2R4XL61_9BURK|nr:MBL fold metallo-hydrolase [Orrella marina]AWB34548.1 MBL fold metallo-hydrolase [Orrella marina]